jgi:eukaryotic-like serine/threonine-protein kinase
MGVGKRVVAPLRPDDPRTIGPYRLLGQLGCGGMGRVFLGLSAGGRPIAVKVIRAELAADPEFRTRFSREVAAARKVSGVYTAHVVDADLDSEVPWLATAYVRGPSLTEVVRGHGPLPVNTVLALAAGLAESLNAIHAVGVVHRDLKPSNVLLAEDGPRVIDFGISQAVEASALPGLDFGSPGFMSPEQALGHDIAPSADIFSLGAVLTYAATGHGPFGSGSSAALVYRLVNSPARLDDLPEELRRLVGSCLAKHPSDRPTASQLLADVGAIQPESGWLPAPVFTMFTQGQPAASTSTPGSRPPAPAVASPAIASLAGSSAVGSSAAGPSVADSSAAGPSVAGPLVAGSSVAGSSVAGASLVRTSGALPVQASGGGPSSVVSLVDAPGAGSPAGAALAGAALAGAALAGASLVRASGAGVSAGASVVEASGAGPPPSWPGPSSGEPPPGSRPPRRRWSRSLASAWVTGGLLAASAAAIFALTGAVTPPPAPQAQPQVTGAPTTAGSASQPATSPGRSASARPGQVGPSIFQGPSASAFLSPTASASVLPTPSPSQSGAPRQSASPSPSASVSSSQSASSSPTPTPTPTTTSPTGTPTPTPTTTSPTPTPTPTTTSPTPTPTPTTTSPTPTPTTTSPTGTPTATASSPAPSGSAGTSASSGGG